MVFENISLFVLSWLILVYKLMIHEPFLRHLCYHCLNRECCKFWFLFLLGNDVPSSKVSTHLCPWSRYPCTYKKYSLLLDYLLKYLCTQNALFNTLSYYFSTQKDSSRSLYSTSLTNQQYRKNHQIHFPSYVMLADHASFLNVVIAEANPYLSSNN